MLPVPQPCLHIRMAFAPVFAGCGPSQLLCADKNLSDSTTFACSGLARDMNGEPETRRDEAGPLFGSRLHADALRPLLSARDRCAGGRLQTQETGERLLRMT